MSEEAVQRLMGLAREAIRSAVLSETRGGRNYEQDADEDLEALESALREVLKQPLGVPAAPSRSPSQAPPIADATCEVGDYVLATKYCDGDPGDRWAVGFYAGMERDRHMVKDSDGKNIHVGGYRGVIRIPLAVGEWLLKNARVLESSPPGAVNLLQMVATQFNADRIDEETA